MYKMVALKYRYASVYLNDKSVLKERILYGRQDQGTIPYGLYKQKYDTHMVNLNTILSRLMRVMYAE